MPKVIPGAIPRTLLAALLGTVGRAVKTIRYPFFPKMPKKLVVLRQPRAGTPEPCRRQAHRAPRPTRAVAKGEIGS